MAVRMQMACDVCGALRGAENHWLVAITRPDVPRTITIAPASAPIPAGAVIDHLCGEACAQVRVSRALSTEDKETA